jgi:DNA-binding SARP family transcriptional activator
VIQLRTLGALDLRDSDGRALVAVMAQPKRLALLTYLALASPDGFLRRDKLVGLFWGESDERHARAALRQALRYLRRLLGDDVIVSRVEEEVGIGAGTLSCDALELRLALGRGDDADVVGLYRGDLLPDFHLAGAPAFARWLEAERTELRAAAGAAVVRLATAAEACDDLEAATNWMRRAVDLAPTDELVARRLMRLLQQTGNRAAAAAVYEHLVERLRMELDVEPSPLTETLMTEIRSRPSRTPRVATSLVTTPQASGAGGLEPRRVLVTVFENRTGEPALDALGRLAADWLAQGLALLPDFEVVPAGVAAESGRAVTDLTLEGDAGGSVHALAEATRAGIVIGGAYYLDGPDTRFQARITDAIEGQLIPSPGWVPVKQSDPFTGFEALRERVTVRLASRLSPRAVHVRRALQAPAYEAYRLYMEGLEFFVRADWAGSLTCFRQSAALDRAYALPRIVCAIAHWNLGQLDDMQQVAVEASALRDTLGAFERAVLDMVLAWLRGDWVASYEAARRQADLAPASIPHFQVAE